MAPLVDDEYRAEERDPDHQIPRQLFGHDQRLAERVAQDDLDDDDDGHHGHGRQDQSLEREGADEHARPYLFMASPMSTSSLPLGPRSGRASE